MRLILSLALCLGLYVSCKTKSNKHIEKLSGPIALPEDSLAFYFPKISDVPRVDTFVQNWYSSTLFSLKEPILSKRFVGHNIFRFLWLRSFHKPAVFSFHNDNGKVWLNTKMLDQYPQFNDHHIMGVSDKDRSEYLKAGYFQDSTDSDLLIRKADRKANIVYAKEILLTNKEWSEFENLLKKANYWDIQITGEQDGTDGSEWIIEVHSRNKYRFVNRWSPGGDFRELGLYLIKLSGLKEEIY